MGRDGAAPAVFGNRGHAGLQDHIEIARPLRIVGCAQPLQEAPGLGRAGRRWRGRDLVARKSERDLRVGAIGGERGGDRPGAIGGREGTIDPHIPEGVAEQDGAGQAELLRDRLAHRGRTKRRIGALRLRDRLVARAFGQVEPAMVGGQRNGIIDMGCIEPIEEQAERAI